jgi:hypothetical protein
MSKTQPEAKVTKPKAKAKAKEANPLQIPAGTKQEGAKGTKAVSIAQPPESENPPAKDNKTNPLLPEPKPRPVDKQLQMTSAIEIAEGVAVLKRIAALLLKAGFKQCGSSISHFEKGITVEPTSKDSKEFLKVPVQIVVDGIDTEDLQDWAELKIKEDLDNFASGLIEWATAHRSEESGFDQACPVDDKALQHLPSPQSLGADPNRVLHIVSWGKKHHNPGYQPPGSQFNFNACVLNGRGGGVDLRSARGTDKQLQINVASCSLFPGWISMVINKIESAGLSHVSICCTAGHHRSVAAAEMLKNIYYPKATVKHIHINR